MNGGAESDPEKPRERYGDSYLAMDASQKKPVAAKPGRRRSGRKGRLLFWLILLAGALVYFQRERIVPWLEQNRRTAPLVQFLREPFGTADGAGAVGSAGPIGGETTFSFGQGSGTVLPDDGADTFRVIQPPESTPTR